MKRFEIHSMVGALLLALVVAMPAAAQDEDPEQNATAMMQSPMAQYMQHCMMMMQTMHGGMMMNRMPGMMQDSVRAGAVMGGEGMHGMMGGQGMMGDVRTGQGMMGMQNPMHRSMMLVHVLPSMQEPLDLSEAQVAQLAQAEESLMDAHTQMRENMTTSQERLHDLLSQEDADPADVEALMKRIAENRAEMHSAVFATAQEMKQMLNADQRAALGDMDTADMHQHMMQNMSMMEMMQMMQKMHGQPPGASGGMMQPASMQPHDGPPPQHRQHHN